MARVFSVGPGDNELPGPLAERVYLCIASERRKGTIFFSADLLLEKNQSGGEREHGFLPGLVTPSECKNE